MKRLILLFVLLALILALIVGYNTSCTKPVREVSPPDIMTDVWLTRDYTVFIDGMQVYPVPKVIPPEYQPHIWIHQERAVSGTIYSYTNDGNRVDIYADNNFTPSKEVIKEVPVYITIEVTKEETVWDRTIASRGYPIIHWDTLQELEDFLANDDTDQNIFISPSHPDGQGLCVTYAQRLWFNAMKAGRAISWQRISAREYYELFGVVSESDHLMNLAYVGEGQTIYLIEPQTDEIWPINKVVF